MKRLLAASLVVLAALFLSPQSDAFLPGGDRPGFYPGGGGERAALDLDFRLGGLDSRITYTRASAATCFNSAGTLTTFASGAARLPCYTYDGANWINRGFLIEEARTNVALQSEALGTTWTNPGANTTITDNAGVAVDGATTAEDVLHGDSAETIQQTITATDNTVYTICANVKQGSTGPHDFVKIAWLDESAGANGFEAWYDISDGTVGTAQADGTGSYTSGSAVIIDLSGGWYRVCATGQIVSGQTDARFEIINTTADAVDTAEATNSVFWWGLMAEAGAFSTSYSKTTTGQAVRAADVPNMAVSDIAGFSTTEGTIYIRAHQLIDTNDTSSILNLNDDSNSDLIRFTRRSGDNAKYEVKTAGSTIVNLDQGGIWGADTAVDVIGAWKADDFEHFVDGARVGSGDQGGDVPPGLLTLRIGTDSGGSDQFNGSIARITLWNRRLPNGRLQDKTAFLDLFDGTMYAANDNDEEQWLEAVEW